MKQGRIAGFVTLHSIGLCLLLEGLFHGIIAVFRKTELVLLNADVNYDLYSLGIIVASVSIHRHLRVSMHRYGRKTNRETLHVTAQQMMRVMLMIFALVVVTKDAGVSRAFLLSYMFVSGTLVFLANTHLPRLLTFLFLRDSIQRAVIAAPAAGAIRLRTWINDKYAESSVHVVGYVADVPSADETVLPWLGTPQELVQIVGRESIGQVLIDRSVLDPDQEREITAGCERLGCRVRSFVDILSLLPPNADFEHHGQYAFATTTPEPLNDPLNCIAKRGLDIVIALPVIFLVLPIVALITFLFQSAQAPGPLLYKQWRSGINRRRFMILKFRTMYVSGGADAARQATKNDSRIFAFGRFLRRTSLDELPQFLNVLRGEMSVSGPRPHLLEHDEMFARIVGGYRKRHYVKPGITGLAQSKGFRGEIGEESAIVQRVHYDMHYVSKWSLLMDVKIIFITVRQILYPPSSAC